MTHLSHCSIHPIPYIASFSLLYYSSCIGMSIYIWPIDWLRTLVFANNGCGFGLAKGACGGGRWWANPSYPLPSAGAGALALRLWSARRRKTTRYCLRHKCPPLAPTPSRRAFSHLTSWYLTHPSCFVTILRNSATPIFLWPSFNQ